MPEPGPVLTLTAAEPVGAAAAAAAPAWPNGTEQLGYRYPYAGQVAQAPGVRAWVAAMFQRNRRGTIAGIIAAWFPVPYLVLLAATGAVLGGVAGVFHGTVGDHGINARVDELLHWVLGLPKMNSNDLLPTFGVQIGGIVGGILGAISGAVKIAWLGIVDPVHDLYMGDPLWPFEWVLGQVVTAFFVGLLYLAWRLFVEGSRMRVAGARRMSRREADWLMPIVLEVAARLGLGALPRVLIDDRREPNAHAAIRHIVVDQGLLEQLAYDREAIAAVIAHELVHWRDGDAISMVWARGVALPLYLLYELASRMLRSTRSRPVQFIIRVLLWPVLVTVRYGVIPIQASVWRRAEYRADAIAAAAGYGEGLRTVLTHVRRSFDGSRSGWDAAVCATHPPNELRLEALEAAGRTYPLREDHPLARSVPGWTGTGTVQKGW
jgi:Zn-dependent protease with chaperone function